MGMRLNVGKSAIKLAGIAMSMQDRIAARHDSETADECLMPCVKRDTTIDIAGGQPNSHFHSYCAADGRRVIDRSNLTILLAPGFTDLPEFLAEHQVEIIASLPCYLEKNCDHQRGSGVFQRSIEALRRLNELDYGRWSPYPDACFIHGFPCRRREEPEADYRAS
jgi:hypothetical protein